MTIEEKNRFQLLTIFDFSNEEIYTKIRYGIPVEKVKCNIKFEYVGLTTGGYSEYMASGGSDKFITDLATTMGIDEHYIDVTQIEEGSVVVDYVLQTD